MSKNCKWQTDARRKALKNRNLAYRKADHDYRALMKAINELEKSLKENPNE